VLREGEEALCRSETSRWGREDGERWSELGDGESVILALEVDGDIAICRHYRSVGVLMFVSGREVGQARMGHGSRACHANIC
jgi:hypothetical protein